MGGPLYKLTALDGDRWKSIEIDVTKSASSFSSVGDGLKTVLRSVLSNTALGINDVVEFGAGKLKNVPFVLQAGKSISAVEFDRLNANRLAQRNYSICQAYGEKFRRLTPQEFAHDEQKYDLAMLVNVLATMPHAPERVEVLDLLHDKLRDGKYALVFWLKDDDRYRQLQHEGKECTDGIWLGDGRRHQTFYRRFSPEEIIALMHDSGFVPFNRFYVETNHAFLFRRS